MDEKNKKLKRDDDDDDDFKELKNKDIQRVTGKITTTKTPGQIKREKIRIEIQTLRKFTTFTPQEIADKLNCSLKTVYRWIKNEACPVTKKKSRKLKLNARFQKWIYNHAKNKNTSEASAKKILIDFRKTFKKYRNVAKISRKTVNNYLKGMFHKPIKIRKEFLNKEKHINARMEFCKMIIEKNIKGEDIFFTDEKNFSVGSMPNKQATQYRFSKKQYASIKEGSLDPRAFYQEKFPESVMVAGGFSYYGQGKIIFCIGNVDGLAYKNAVNYYMQDITDHIKRPHLLFQQDNARCHLANNDYIDKHFQNRLQWPPNSPDLNPIEIIWAHMEQQISILRPKTLEEYKTKIVMLWNRLPRKFLRNLAKGFNKRVRRVYELGGKAYIKKTVKKKLD